MADNCASCGLVASAGTVIRLCGCCNTFVERFADGTPVLGEPPCISPTGQRGYIESFQQTPLAIPRGAHPYWCYPADQCLPARQFVRNERICDCCGSSAIAATIRLCETCDRMLIDRFRDGTPILMEVACITPSFEQAFIQSFRSSPMARIKGETCDEDRYWPAEQCLPDRPELTVAAKTADAEVAGAKLAIAESRKQTVERILNNDEPLTLQSMCLIEAALEEIDDADDCPIVHWLSNQLIREPPEEDLRIGCKRAFGPEDKVLRIAVKIDRLLAILGALLRIYISDRKSGGTIIDH